MEEVQGSERTVRIELGKGAAVFIRACNTARGEIKAEGVVGMARSCFAAGAAGAAAVPPHDERRAGASSTLRIRYPHGR